MKTVVGITHWPNSGERCEYLRQVLDSLAKNWADLKSYFMVVSILPTSHDDPSYQRSFVLADKVSSRTAVRMSHFDIAEHINLLKEEYEEDHFLLLQDDWILTRPWTLAPHQQFLGRNPQVGLLHLTATRGLDTEPFPGEDNYRIVTPLSNAVYCDHPAIHTPLLREVCGPLPEGHGVQGESQYNKIVRKAVEEGKLVVASLPVEQMRSPPLWKHIGKRRTVLRKLNPVEFGVTKFGGTFQHPDTFALFERLLDWHKPETIVELGGGNGNFARWIASVAVDSQVHSFDRYRKVRDLHPVKNLTYHLGDVFCEQMGAVESLLIKGGRTLLLCDDGDKPLEFTTFAERLGSGDMIGVHDYGDSRKEFAETMRKPNRWRACECTWDDVRETVEGRFDRVWRDTTLPIAWGLWIRR